jgi:hypothetical protein
MSNEHLKQLRDICNHASQLKSEIQAAYGDAAPLEELVLRPMIDLADALHKQASALQRACESEVK